MKYAIISDIHANLEAAEACLREIEKLKADRIICLGDLVDYCAQPNEVISLIKNNCDVVILGNHDEAQFHQYISERFREFARISSVHTRGILHPENLEYIKTLPFTHSENNLLFVHACPFEPANYKYVLNEEAAGVGQRLLLKKGRDARGGKEDGFDHCQAAAGSRVDCVTAKKAKRAEGARAGLITKSADSSRWPVARRCHIFHPPALWIGKRPG